MVIDRRVLGVDLTIGRVDLLPGIFPVRVVVYDVKVKQPTGFTVEEHGENMATVERVEVDIALMKLLWTWLSPRARIIDIKGIRLIGVDVAYAMRSPDQGLEKSNVFKMVEHIRSIIRRGRARATPASSARRFHLAELRTFGLSASLSVEGVDLPIEHQRLAIVDLNFSDFMHELRENVLKPVQEARAEGATNPEDVWGVVDGVMTFLSADSSGGGLVSAEDIIGGIVEQINAQILEGARAQAWGVGADLVGSSFASTARFAEQALREFDADGDGNITAEEIAAKLWYSLVAQPPKEG